jgi:hypothetical protein
VMLKVRDETARLLDTITLAEPLADLADVTLAAAELAS